MTIKKSYQKEREKLRRQLASELIVASLVLVVTLSFIIAPVAVGCEAGNVNEVLSKLKALRNDVLELPDCAFKKSCSASSYRRVLAQKIEVVTHMVEVGAYNGAIHKLENDVKKLVEHWVTEKCAKGLIEKIDEIINLLKKLKPPCPPHLQDFAVTASPDSLTVEQGSTNSSTIMVISLNGFNKPVNLTAVTSSPISGVVINLNPPQFTLPKDDYTTSTLTVAAAKNASIGAYTITVKATSEHLEHSLEISLKITPSPPPPPAFDFRITANPLSLKVQQGGSNVSVIVITSLTAASQPVDLAVTSKSINSVRAVLNPSQVIPPSNNSAISLLTVQANVTAPLGDHTITVTGTSGVLKRSLNITLKVMAPPIQPTPDFIVAAFPSSLSIQAGDSGTSTIVVLSVRGFNQSVNLMAACEPSKGVTLSLNPTKVVPQPNDFANSTLAVKVNSTAALGAYKITVTGTSGSLIHSVNLSLTVTGPPLPPFVDFSLTVSPSSLKVQQGGLGASSMIVTSLKGFNQPVGLVATPVGGINLALEPLQVTPPPNGVASSTLTVSVYATAIPGKYEITVTGTSGDLKHDTKILLEVTAEKEPPQIVSVLRLPENPAYNDSVAVLALVTDVGSGVRGVVLSYSNSVVWANVTMVLKEGLYSAGIPAFAYSTVVKYRVYASDRAGNWATSDLNSYTVSDPYAPVIGDPSWMPAEPDANVDITINVTVTEPTGSSGVRNVTLWFKSKTLDWRAVPMTFANGTWTAKLSNQSDTLIDFKITAYDYAGNSAETKLYQFQVKVPTGLPLSLILLVIIILAALTGSIIYLLWRRRQKRKSAGGAPKPTPPSPPSAAQKLAAPIRGYEMVSFVVPARNEGSTISQRIARAYERAVNHVGPSEIIVVDDGSLDDTYEAAWSAIKSNRRMWPNIPAKVVKLSSALGKEEAIQICRNKATGEIIETVNGDTSKIPSLIVPIGRTIYV